jgi:hypothetical protein
MEAVRTWGRGVHLRRFGAGDRRPSRPNQDRLEEEEESLLMRTCGHAYLALIHWRERGGNVHLSAMTGEEERKAEEEAIEQQQGE